VTASNQLTRKPGLLSLLVASIVVAGVSFVSFLPVRGKRALHTEGHLHVGLHFVAFSLVGFVFFRVARSRTARIAAFAGAVLFGFLIEEGEHLIYGGGMEWKDVLTDAIGVLAGTLLAVLFASRSRRPDQG
jgi:hypothetical protein